MVFSRLNALSQALDVAGSLTQTQTMTLSEEPSGYGAPISGQTGSSANITTVSSGIATVTGLTGMAAQSVGRFLTISGAASSGNNGTFLIVAFTSSSSVDVANASAVASDANNGSISWTERNPYALEDDVNYTRTDRKLIKGTSNFYDDVPTYQRPTAIGTNVPANLTNIAGKTTDAQGFIFPRGFRAQAVSSGDGYVTLTSTNNFRHADATNKTGVPMFDAAPYTGDRNACYVLITDPVNDNQLTAVGGATDGYVIFGLSRNGTTSTSPDSIEVVFYAVPHGADLSTAVTYTWDSSQPTTIDLTYGYFLRLDQADEYSFRRLQILGVESDADLRQDVDYLQQSTGISDGLTNLSTLLTNTSNYFAFSDLPDATPSVVEALNTLNTQIGDRSYTGSVLTDGETITSSLQALSDAMSTTTITRTIERLGSSVLANTAHTLPGGITYTLDGTNNGRNLFVWTRGLMRDPGSIVSGNDYAETSTTQVTFYAGLLAGDHINYIVIS